MGRSEWDGALEKSWQKIEEKNLFIMFQFSERKFGVGVGGVGGQNVSCLLDMMSFHN